MMSHITFKANGRDKERSSVLQSGGSLQLLRLVINWDANRFSLVVCREAFAIGRFQACLGEGSEGKQNMACL